MALQILTISTLTHVHWVLSKKLASASFTFLSPLFMTSHGSLPRARSSLYLWITLRSLDTLWTSPPGWSSSSYPLDFSSCWSLPNWSPYHPRQGNVSSDTSINVLRPLVIPVILSEMNRTLAIAMNPNWIMYDTESLDQSSQPQASFDASTAAMYFASVIERAMVSCNSAFQLMIHSATVNT